MEINRIKYTPTEHDTEITYPAIFEHIDCKYRVCALDDTTGIVVKEGSYSVGPFSHCVGHFSDDWCKFNKPHIWKYIGPATIEITE